jgi:hypothetical protein
MSGICNCLTAEGLLEQLDFQVRETEAGVTVEVTPRDPKDAGALKGLVNGLKTFVHPKGCC